MSHIRIAAVVLVAALCTLGVTLVAGDAEARCLQGPDCILPPCYDACGLDCILHPDACRCGPECYPP